MKNGDLDNFLEENKRHIVEKYFLSIFTYYSTSLILWILSTTNLK